MRIGKLNVNSDIKTILEKMIFELHQSGSKLFTKKLRDSGDYYLVQCPYHKYGQERHPSAQFRKSDGLFYCHGCKESHQLPTVITYCLNKNGYTWLRDTFQTSEIEERQVDFNLPIKSNESKSTTNFINKEILKKYRFTHPYMFERKLNLETIRKFDVGYDHEHDCITFPNKDPQGNIVFIATRNIQNKYFHYPENVDKPVYGLYEIYREIRKGTQIDAVYICESMINCLTIWSWGKFAVALNGTGSSYQLNILRKCGIRHFILALDPDDAGQKGTEKLLAGLDNKLVEVVIMPKGKDVNDCTYEEFFNLEIKTRW